MKITSFNPLIVTKDAETVIRLFEELGFERRHKSEGTNDNSGFITTRMKDGNGFYADISQSEKIPADMTAIRMNVDDFEGTIKLLESNGFVNANGGRVTDLGSSKSVFMRAPSGFCISVVKHIKNHE
jgi:predicted RNA binding protein YcfA (HicA-like mRNA interferase family)